MKLRCFLVITVGLVITGLIAIASHLMYMVNSSFKNTHHEFKDEIEQLKIEIGSLREKNSKLSLLVYKNSDAISLQSDEEEQPLVELKSEMVDIKSELEKELDNIKALNTLVKAEINDTALQLNMTVSEVEESISEEVEKVNDNVSTENTLMAYQFAGTFAIFGSLISVWHMMSHIRNYKQPIVQRKVLAILLLCPIYSVTSWLSLVFISIESYLTIIKDFYEAYCIYTFLSFLIAVLGKGDRNVVVDLLAKNSDNLQAPVQICGLFKGNYDENAHAKADAVLYQCQLCTMQFVLLRPLTSIAMAIIATFHDLQFLNYASPEFYINMITNASVFVAFSGLIKFYYAVHEDLSWCRPFSKFLCIKGVVFMTFWQGFVITILAHMTFDGSENESPEEWSKRAQSFLICLEMFFFAIAHIFVFATEEWNEGFKSRQRSPKKKFGDNMALRDFVHDLKYILRSKKRIAVLDHKDAIKTVMPDAGSHPEAAGNGTHLTKLSHSGGHNLLSDRSIHEDNDLDLACERNLDAQVDDMCWTRIERYIDEINVTSTLEDEDSESLGQMT